MQRILATALRRDANASISPRSNLGTVEIQVSTRPTQHASPAAYLAVSRRVISLTTKLLSSYPSRCTPAQLWHLLSASHSSCCRWERAATWSCSHLPGANRSPALSTSKDQVPAVLQVKLLQFVRPSDFDNFRHFTRWRDTTAAVVLQILTRASRMPLEDSDKWVLQHMCVPSMRWPTLSTSLTVQNNFKHHFWSSLSCGSAGLYIGHQHRWQTHEPFWAGRLPQLTSWSCPSQPCMLALMCNPLPWAEAAQHHHGSTGHKQGFWLHLLLSEPGCLRCRCAKRGSITTEAGFACCPAPLAVCAAGTPMRALPTSSATWHASGAGSGASTCATLMTMMMRSTQRQPTLSLRQRSSLPGTAGEAAASTVHVSAVGMLLTTGLPTPLLSFLLETWSEGLLFYCTALR